MDKATEAMVTLLKEGKKWDKLKTTTGGLFVKLLPESKTQPARLCAEINPVDESGMTTKKSGYHLRGLAEVAPIRKILESEELTRLLEKCDEVNLEVNGEAPVIGTETIIEI